MIPSIYTLDGHAINDGTNYRSYFPESTVFLGPKGTPNIVSRAFNFPKYVNTIRDGSLIPLHIIMLGDIPSQSDTLKGWFDVLRGVEIQLIVKDTANSNEQWYWNVIPRTFDQLIGAEFVLLLDIPDMVKTRVTQSHQQLLATASGQTITLTPTGNHPVDNLIVAIKPTSYKAGVAGQFKYNRFLTLKNTLTTVFSKYGYDLCSDAFDTQALIADSGVSNQINEVGNITSGQLSFHVDTAVGGGLPTTGGMCMVDTEQIYYTDITAGVMNVYNVGGVTGRGWGGTTAASHLDNAILKLSHMQANGNDLRIYVDGVQVDRWLDGINTTTTKVWLNIDLKSRAQFYLWGGGIAGAGPVSTVQIAVYFSGFSWSLFPAFVALPDSGIFRIGNEIFTYTGKDISAGTFTGVSRAAKRTSAAAHSNYDAVSFIEHDVWMFYGDPGLTAQLVDDSNKPMFDLDTSTNASLVFTSLTDVGSQRSNQWGIGFGLKATNADAFQFIYTAANGAQADPATYLGLAELVQLFGTAYKYPAGNVNISYLSPVGISTITATGEKKKVGTPWPLVTMIAYSPASPTGVTLWTEATPTSGAGFVAWTAHAAVAASGATRLQLTINAGVSPVTGAVGGMTYCALNDVTLAMVSGDIPTCEIGSEFSGYDLDATLSNAATSGQSLSVRWNLELNSTLTLDCGAHTALYSVDGRSAIVSLDDQARFDWLPLVAGVANILTLTDPLLVGLTLDCYWNDRMS